MKTPKAASHILVETEMLQTAVPAAGVLSYSLAPGDFFVVFVFILQKRASSFSSYDTLFFLFSFSLSFPLLSLLLSVIHRMAFELLQRRASNFHLRTISQRPHFPPSFSLHYSYFMSGSRFSGRKVKIGVIHIFLSF
jgi:hypothetical protein